MSELVADCPRCGASRITFDLTQENLVKIQYEWQYWYEVFCICRHCKHATIFVLSQNTESHHAKDLIHENGLLKIGGAVNRYMDIEGFVNLKDNLNIAVPEHVPEDISAVFEEGGMCLSVGCYNAAGTMFRLCVDLATRAMLPEQGAEPLNAKTRRSLGLRLPWLLDHGYLPIELRELSSCVKEDGNDGAHDGSLEKEDAHNLLDFTTLLLERIYTEPERLRLAQERRNQRRGQEIPTKQ